MSPFIIPLKCFSTGKEKGYEAYVSLENPDLEESCVREQLFGLTDIIRRIRRTGDFFYPPTMHG